MSKKPGIKEGQWCGGIRSITDLKNRCRIDDETGCWNWMGGKTKGKYPKISMKIHGVNHAFSGVKVAMLLSGHEVGDGMTVFHYKCTSNGCLNPGHLKVGTFKDKWAHIKDAGYLRGSPSRSASNKAVAMKRCKVVEHMDLILNSDKTNTELAKELGLHRTTICNARKNLAGSSQIANASVFTWRPAA